MSNKPDIDPQETQEWLDALDAVLENEGVERTHFLLERLVDKAGRSGAYLPYSANTAYVNTIPVQSQERFPGAAAMERRIRSFIRWNAMAMVVQANRIATELGGHIASFACSATLYATSLATSLGVTILLAPKTAPNTHVRRWRQTQTD